MKTIFHVLNHTDLYEIALQDRLITRITKYLHGSQQRQEIKEWDSLSADVKTKIEEEARKLLHQL